MRIINILNNNAVMVRDDSNKEMIVIKNGIGFSKKKGDLIHKFDVDKLFTINEKGISKSIINSFSNIPESILQVTKEIIGYGQNIMNDPLNESIKWTLADHIQSVIQRSNQGIEIVNPMNWDIKKIYPEAYEVGKYAVKKMNEHFNVSVLSDEAGFIAMHFVNASINTDTKSVQDITAVTILVKSVLNLVSKTFKYQIDETQVEYYRFVRHLQFFAHRIIGSENMKINKEIDSVLKNIIFEKYNLAFDCAIKIKKLIEYEYSMSIDNDEVFYLTLHISKLIV